jgi:hypothetical protein
MVGIVNRGTLTVTDCLITGCYAYSFYVYNGTEPHGGGIYNDGTLTVTTSTFSGNSVTGYFYYGDFGGGGIGNDGTLTVTDSTFSGNSAGGIIGDSGTVTITDSTFSSNAGGGIPIFGGTLTVTGSTFSSNVGGGIFNDYFHPSTLTVTNSTFSGNVGSGISGSGTLTVTDSTFSSNVGSGILSYGTTTVTDCTFSGNSATSDYSYYGGGGIYNGGTLTVTDSTFSGNSATGKGSGGGIINWFSSTLTVIDSTFSGNSAGSDGGGIYNVPGMGRGFPPGTVKMRNILTAGNRANSGPDVSGTLISLGHNLIGDGSGGSGYTATDLVGTSANPIDPMLGPLQDNGGPTWTMALLPDSPAIGAGGPTDSEWDQRGPGYARSVNGMTDIGAYEVQPSGAGAAALSLYFPEQIHPVPVVALSRPSLSSIPLRPAATALDRLFASWTNWSWIRVPTKALEGLVDASVSSCGLGPACGRAGAGEGRLHLYHD